MIENLSFNSKICIFGCGYFGKLLHKKIREYRSDISCIFCDNDKSKYDNPCYEVISPKDAVCLLVKNELEVIILSGTTSFTLQLEMLTQISQLGVSADSIYIACKDFIYGITDFDKKCFVKLSEICMNELLGYSFHATPVSYQELQSKKLLLIGNKKFMADISDYFIELDFVKCNSLSPLNNSSELYILCDFERENFKEEIEKNGLIYIANYIWIDDLINILHESETYYTSVYNPDKQVVVLGERLLTQLLLKGNPNIKLHSLIYISDWNQNLKTLIVNRVGLYQKNILFLLVTGEHISAKHAMEEAGYILGDDFYFYDSINAKLSDMLTETIISKSFLPFDCGLDSRPALLLDNGYFHMCASRINSYSGNVLFNSFENIVFGPMSRILHLSTINRTYCFCNESCTYIQKPLNEKLQRNNKKLPKLSDYRMNPCYITACNLYCRSCRKERIVDDPEPIKVHIHNEMLSVLSKIKRLEQSHGEILFSKMGRELLEVNSSSIIKFSTNGILLNKSNWEYILRLYNEVYVKFSIDGATKNTYEYLRRGAKYEIIIENLQIASELRVAGRIKEFRIGCVVQKDNINELVDIINLGRKLKADEIVFTRLTHFGSFTDDELSQLDIHDYRNPLYKDFVKLIGSNKIFHESDVRVVGMEHLMNAYY